MSAGLTGLTSLYSAYGQYEAGKTRSELYTANAEIASRQAASEASAGAYNENVVRMHGAALQGQQVAQIGANNLQQTGTPAQVVSGTAMVNEMDALQTRNNALRRAWGFEVQGTSDQLQAELAKKSAMNEGVGSILSGGARAYDQYKSAGSWF